MTATDVSEYLTGLDDTLREIGQRLRPIMDAALPGASSTMWHGHPVWRVGPAGSQPTCLLKAYNSDITFGLWRGQDITDPSGRLKAGARRMASVKLASTADIDEALFTGWLRQAHALEQR